MFADAGEATGFATLVDGVDDPVDSGVLADLETRYEWTGKIKRQDQTYGLVVGVDQDYLEVLVDTILVNPVRIQDSQISTTSSYTLLGRTSQSTLVLELVDTLSDGFTVGGT